MATGFQQSDWAVESYNYHLPPELIAQRPASPRDSSRLLVYHQASQNIEHKHFREITEYLKAGDVLVLNNTKVIPARIFGRKKTGGRVEIFLLNKTAPTQWECLIRPWWRVADGCEVEIEESASCPQKKKLSTVTGNRTTSKTPAIEFAREPEKFTAIIGPATEAGSRLVEFPWAREDFFENLARLGQVPLPPYIKTSPSPEISRAYQTVFAAKDGAVAAPTAGLHFSEELLKKIQSQGIELAYITLHTGWGTFQPIKSADIRRHKIHPEFVEITAPTASQINQALKDRRRLIFVGTTCVRALESAACPADDKNQPGLEVKPFCGPTELYIYPGYQFKIVRHLLTNFHLPRSSLLALVAALIGREKLLEIYRLAIKKKYRLFSFGDAMLII